MSVCGEFQHLEVPILWVIFLLKKLCPSHYISSVPLDISFLNRIWSLISTSLSNLQFPPQLAGISRQLKIFFRFMKTCIQNENTNYKCYIFPKAMPASQSWQAVLAVWWGKKQYLKISLSISEATLPPSDASLTGSGTGDFSKYWFKNC